MRGRVVARGHAGGVSDKECASAYEEDKTHLAKTAVPAGKSNMARIRQAEDTLMYIRYMCSGSGGA
jgi:hypothetical protein